MVPILCHQRKHRNQCGDFGVLMKCEHSLLTLLVSADGYFCLAIAGSLFRTWTHTSTCVSLRFKLVCLWNHHIPPMHEFGMALHTSSLDWILCLTVVDEKLFCSVFCSRAKKTKITLFFPTIQFDLQKCSALQELLPPFFRGRAGR